MDSLEDSDYEDYRQRIEKHKTDFNNIIKMTYEKKARINQLIEVLNALQEYSMDSDSSDASFEKIEYLNRMLKRKMKSIKKLTKANKMHHQQREEYWPQEVMYNFFKISRIKLYNFNSTV